MLAKISLKNVLLYLLGFIIAALGIVLLLRSELGAGPWDAVTFNLSALTNWTLGTSSALISGLLMIFMTVANKNLRYLFLVVPLLLIALALDFWDLVIFKDYYPNGWVLQGVFFIIGFYTLTLGLAMIASANFIAMIFEELTRTLMNLFPIDKFATARVFVELFAITTASILGFIAGIKFGAVAFGTLIMAVFIGPIIAFNLKYIFKIRANKS